MAIINRSKDTYEQYEVVNFQIGALATDVTKEFYVVPWPCQAIEAHAVAVGLSGAPTYSLQVQRFIVGTGATVITGLAADQAVGAFGTSGVVELTMATSGSTLLNLEAKDVIEIVSATADTAVTGFNLALVLKKTQDVLSFF